MTIICNTLFYKDWIKERKNLSKLLTSPNLKKNPNFYNNNNNYNKK